MQLAVRPARLAYAVVQVMVEEQDAGALTVQRCLEGQQDCAILASRGWNRRAEPGIALPRLRRHCYRHMKETSAGSPVQALLGGGR